MYYKAFIYSWVEALKYIWSISQSSLTPAVLMTYYTCIYLVKTQVNTHTDTIKHIIFGNYTHCLQYNNYKIILLNKINIISHYFNPFNTNDTYIEWICMLPLTIIFLLKFIENYKGKLYTILIMLWCMLVSDAVVVVFNRDGCLTGVYRTVFSLATVFFFTNPILPTITHDDNMEFKIELRWLLLCLIIVLSFTRPDTHTHTLFSDMLYGLIGGCLVILSIHAHTLNFIICQRIRTSTARKNLILEILCVLLVYICVCVFPFSLEEPLTMKKVKFLFMNLKDRNWCVWVCVCVCGWICVCACVCGFVCVCVFCSPTMLTY
eukprot:GHVR01105074.1.p1 GENE.GHVR01105074.1~~GHVR01105074.1.p1  ORF type:complete len:320 (-),score=75.99 GHVR01105074.1:322-1281(-)